MVPYGILVWHEVGGGSLGMTRVPDAPDHLLGKLVLGLVHSTWFNTIRVAASNIRDSFV